MVPSPGIALDLFNGGSTPGNLVLTNKANGEDSQTELMASMLGPLLQNPIGFKSQPGEKTEGPGAKTMRALIHDRPEHNAEGFKGAGVEDLAEAPPEDTATAPAQ
ncbi:hypothetical protein FRB98_003273 [Tulasnella sp. 332]|nr:hypothetical protein FRB98_003273 [Tulasnella sp. 332]